MKKNNEFLELFNEKKMAILEYLVDQEEPVTIKDVRNATGLTQITVTSELVGLKKAGMIKVTGMGDGYTIGLIGTCDLVKAFNKINDAFLKHQERKL